MLDYANGEQLAARCPPDLDMPTHPPSVTQAVTDQPIHTFLTRQGKKSLLFEHTHTHLYALPHCEGFKGILKCVYVLSALGLRNFSFLLFFGPPQGLCTMMANKPQMHSLCTSVLSQLKLQQLCKWPYVSRCSKSNTLVLRD